MLFKEKLPCFQRRGWGADMGDDKAGGKRVSQGESLLRRKGEGKCSEHWLHLRRGRVGGKAGGTKCPLQERECSKSFKFKTLQMVEKEVPFVTEAAYRPRKTVRVSQKKKK